MFHFPAFPPHTLFHSGAGNWTRLQLGFPIRTSPDQRSVANSPGHFAGSHVLHRLSMPRHPPCALTNLPHQTLNTPQQTHTNTMRFEEDTPRTWHNNTQEHKTIKTNNQQNQSHYTHHTPPPPTQPPQQDSHARTSKCAMHARVHYEEIKPTRPADPTTNPSRPAQKPAVNRASNNQQTHGI
jgi:hypothetical protein